MTIDEAISYQNTSAQKKTESTSRLGSYAVSSMLAGSYIGIGVVLMCAAAGPFLTSHAPAAKLVSGLVFGIALTLVTVAGGELLTSNMMTLTQGAHNKAITRIAAARTMTLCFIGNLVGSALFAGFVFLGGTFKQGSAAYAYLEYTVTSKASSTPIEVLFKGILCNIIVCLAIWAGIRLKSEGARLTVIFWCALAFITAGFEHVVANMTTFSLALFVGVPDITALDFASNMIFAGLGNLIGGGVIVGLGYSLLARSERKAKSFAQAA
ncbi:formate/nitrite transporter family protein [Timonella sp. A28]|uniref:formate/nitrite transporter family protein n=1 Tax=Timonella sp. A28 TaxID=3442640 RepID=UPI003EC067CC